MKHLSASDLVARLSGTVEKTASVREARESSDLTDYGRVEKLASACDFALMQINFVSQEELPEQQSSVHPHVRSALDKLAAAKDAKEKEEGTSGYPPAGLSVSKKTILARLAMAKKNKGKKASTDGDADAEAKEEDRTLTDALPEDSNASGGREKSASVLASLLAGSLNAELKETEDTLAEDADTASGDGEKVAQRSNESEGDVAFAVNKGTLADLLRARYTGTAE